MSLETKIKLDNCIRKVANHFMKDIEIGDKIHMVAFAFILPEMIEGIREISGFKDASKYPTGSPYESEIGCIGNLRFLVLDRSEFA